jgi:steroid Delta-isomerase
MADSQEKVTQHIAAFNVAVESGEWDRFAERFAEDAVMRFTNAPAGPFNGRAEIARGYVRQPPDETMSILDISTDGETDTVRFAWASGAAGTMLLTWRGPLVSELVITFGSVGGS